MSEMDEIRERFWSKAIHTASGCWEWTGKIDRYGYGRFITLNRTIAAHRFAYESAKGPIGPGWTVDHLCFNPSCVNPEHLRLLSASENARNQRSSFKKHCIHGHEFTPENTYPRASGGRQCRTCRRDVSRRQYERKRRAARGQS